MRKEIIFGLLVLALNSFASSENDFWTNYKNSDFKSASLISEELGEAKIDYLFLSAVCDHNTYDYELYYQKTDYYHYLKNGNYSSLKKLLLKNYEEDYSINNLMGIVKILIPDIDLNSAKSYFEKSVELKENNPIAHNYLSMIHLQNGKVAEAIDLAQLAIKEDDTYPEPYNNLTFAYYKKGENKKAVDNLIQCMKMCPKNTNSTYVNFIQLSCKEVVLMVNNSIIGVPAFETSLDRDYVFTELKGKNNALLGLANQFFSYNSYKEVDLILDEININDADQSRYYYLRSLNATVDNDTNAYEENLNGLVQLKDFDFVLEVGNYLFGNQNMELALLAYKKALPIANTDESKMKAHANIGAVELNLGNYSNAIESFENSLEINNKDDITLTNLGITYALSNDNVNAKKYLLKAKENCSSENQMNAIKHWLDKIKE